MRKTRIPYYIFPLSKFCSSVVNLLFTIVAFIIVLVFTRTPVTIHVLAFPLVLVQLFLFCFGLGMFLAQAHVIVRDTAYIYSAFTTAWMYLTPLFYPIENLPETLRNIIVHWNPAYCYVAQMRDIFLVHQWSDPAVVLRGFAAGLIFLAIGLFAYSRSKDNLILHV